MRRGIVTILIISMVIIVFTSSVFSQTTKSPGQTEAPINIGGSLALTGVFSEGGKLVKAGYEFWAEDINKRGAS